MIIKEKLIAHKDYDEYQGKYSTLSPRESDIHLIQLVEKFGIKEFPLIDIGCSTGNFINMFNNAALFKSVSIIGVDIEESSINVARSRISGVKFVKADVLDSYWLEAANVCELRGGKYYFKCFTFLF